MLTGIFKYGSNILIHSVLDWVGFGLMSGAWSGVRIYTENSQLHNSGFFFSFPAMRPAGKGVSKITYFVLSWNHRLILNILQTSYVQAQQQTRLKPLIG